MAPRVKGRMASPRLQPCRPGTTVHTCHTAGLVREAACAGAAVCGGQLWFVAVARLRGRHWLRRWGHLAQPVPRHMGRQERSSSSGWGSGWACFPTLGIIPAGWGEGGRQDKPSRCAWPRAPVIQVVRAERSCRGSLDLSTRRLLEQFNPATCPFIPQAGQLCLPINTCNWKCSLVQSPK